MRTSCEQFVLSSIFNRFAPGPNLKRPCLFFPLRSLVDKFLNRTRLNLILGVCAKFWANKKATQRVAQEQIAGSSRRRLWWRLRQRRGRSLRFYRGSSRCLFGLGGQFFPLEITQPSPSLFNFIVLFAHNCLCKNAFMSPPNMWIRFCRFNHYLPLLLVLALVCGCQTGRKPKGPIAILRVHLEASPLDSDHSAPVPIYRADPVLVNVERQPVIDERHVKSAKVVDSLGGFVLQIEFDKQGSLLLEQCSVSYRGRRCAIFCQFGSGKSFTSRWLAAPVLARHITDGVLSFTPDADRDEAEQIASGLNNAARLYQDGKGRPE